MVSTRAHERTRVNHNLVSKMGQSLEEGPKGPVEGRGVEKFSVLPLCAYSVLWAMGERGETLPLPRGRSLDE